MQISKPNRCDPTHFLTRPVWDSRTDRSNKNQVSIRPIPEISRSTPAKSRSWTRPMYISAPVYTVLGSSPVESSLELRWTFGSAGGGGSLHVVLGSVEGHSWAQSHPPPHPPLACP